VNYKFHQFSFYPIPNGTLVYTPMGVFAKLKSALLNQHQFQIFIGLDSIAIHHDLEISEAKLKHFLKQILLGDKLTDNTKKKDFIPIFYDLDSIDWLVIEAKMQRTRDEVIKIHLESSHLIEMYGFLPGYPYIKNLDHNFDIPRKDRPTTRIEPGSVALAGNFTGIYPVESPGGWQIIGKCPIKLFDAQLGNPVKYPIGTIIEFKSITIHEYKSLSSYE